MPPPTGPAAQFSHAVTLTFDLMTPNIEVLILVPKCTNAESQVKIFPILFKILC